MAFFKTRQSDIIAKRKTSKPAAPKENSGTPAPTVVVVVEEEVEVDVEDHEELEEVEIDVDELLEEELDVTVQLICE